RPKSRRLGRRGRRIEGDVLRLRGPRRTDRPAVDAGGPHADEDPAVEPRVAGLQGAVAGVMIEVHAARIDAGRAGVSRFSDITDGRLAVFGPERLAPLAASRHIRGGDFLWRLSGNLYRHDGSPPVR